MNRWLVVSIMLTIVALAGSLYLYEFQRELWPPQVPIQFHIDGSVKNTVSRDSLFGLFLLAPTFMVGWIGVTLLLPWLSPKSFAVEPFLSTYHYAMALVNVFLLYLHCVVLFGTLWAPERVVTLLIAGVFLLFAFVGNILGKVRRNFWLGVRTPWTLADAGVWNATHRHAAYVYTAAGLVGFVAVLCNVNLIALFVCFMVVLAWPAIYSLLLYKYREAHNLLTPVPDEAEPTETAQPTA
jgi:uncharacterized membrane protein